MLQFCYFSHQPELLPYLLGSLSAQSMQWLYPQEHRHIHRGNRAAYCAKCGGDIPAICQD